MSWCRFSSHFCVYLSTKGALRPNDRGQLSRASISPCYRQRMRDVMPRDTYVRDVGRVGGDQGPINIGMEDKIVIERSRVRIPVFGRIFAHLSLTLFRYLVPPTPL